MWSQKDISIYGRINIVKTLALSRLVFICSVMEVPRHFTQEVNKVSYFRICLESQRAQG